MNKHSSKPSATAEARRGLGGFILALVILAIALTMFFKGIIPEHPVGHATVPLKPGVTTSCSAPDFAARFMCPVKGR